MKFGKQHIYDQAMNDITMLGTYAEQVEREARAEGRSLPPPVRLQIGEPSFRTPEHIRQAALQTIANEPLTYGPPAGWPWLRELIAAKIARVDGYSIDPENTAVTLGGTGALMAALSATVGPGDEVLMPDPCWPIYAMQLTAVGVTAVPYPLDPQSEWLPDIARLEKLVTPRTRLLMINTPGNPTGAIFPREIVSALLDFARRHDLYLISDECYDEIIFEGEHVSPATLLTRSELEDGRFIGIYTFSKSYAMTGWRVGYVVASKALTKTITDVLCANHSNISIIVQRAAAAALTGPQDCVKEMRDSYRQRRDLAVRLLKEAGRYVYTPHGAFYALIDVRGKRGEKRGRQFALDLLHERNVAVAPGNGFGKVSEEYVRISLGASDEEIERGVREICQFADR
ncbi:pyridoxal phosphate-dependent aminotransferase [Ktedonosporobacter rubrisoli]|uniref:Pyridoxal phosphate-dependent aminotransferase n=1 Tax=Ktedonosporobacter rubrisoli TaxID=2509675 RepID=A0A4P6JXA1_KTERU|nr:pyridoxal phosphate-dependent aminotransferase [Ktedonosporobacter rubrisoli]QBD80254.1 pyridoxal phosphate-dependent aminotransferase [Ktedonosporobacter rubrisoli]